MNDESKCTIVWGCSALLFWAAMGYLYLWMLSVDRPCPHVVNHTILHRPTYRRVYHTAPVLQARYSNSSAKKPPPPPPRVVEITEDVCQWGRKFCDVLTTLCRS